ncbi:Clp protease ClpP [Listeria monocytogenes]|nr:Clp protease ClpP [Listeria monocytogenes]
MNRKYFALEKHKQTATINIYGDITSWPWFEGDVSAVNLSKQLEELDDVNEINVYINSYGGEVAEGLAIYNALRRHKAKVRTICDGFACSIASVIFMAGDERVMNEASLLMIHNAWTWASGNAAELRKQAEDLDKITQASVEAYKAHSSLKEEEIKALMDAETWILPAEAIDYGFATAIEKTEKANTSQNAKAKLFGIVRAYQENLDDEEELDDTPDDDEQENPDENPDDTTDDDSEDEPGTGDSEDDDPETADDEEEDSSSDDPNADEEEKAAQMWSGFFNALKNM